jgi:formate C-acetyltransferase
MDREYESFQAHFNTILALLDKHIAYEAQHQSKMRTARTKHSFTPLLSCFVNDCLERGLDVENGGARYNWIMPSFVGIPNLVDSLYALKKVVYDDKQLTVLAFKDILDKNFNGNETLRKYLSQKLPKYGNDVDEVDELFQKVTSHILETCKQQKNILHDGKFIPGTFCFTKHEKLGRETGATPDGRLCAKPFSDGAGACQGRAVKGPTAALLSSTKWDHRDFIGGIAVNIKFSSKYGNENALQIMQSLIKTYMIRGGFELQVNVVDKETLKMAQINPDSYRDLVVRIGGYSDYFTRLTPEMQEEVISRTEHTL